MKIQKKQIVTHLQSTFGTMLLLAVLLLFPAALQAQLSISGKVRDKSNQETLPGAHIRIENTLKSSITNSRGAFQLTGIKAGDYRLSVSFLGYKSEIVNIILNESREILVELTPDAIMQDEVIVVSTRSSEQTPVSYVNVNKLELQRQNLGRDLPYLLEATPSVVVTSDAGAGVGYTGIRIRGTDMNRINISLNGIPLNDAESHGVWWVNMPDLAGSIDNIQIQRGVGSSTNGAAAFGANINMQTAVLNEQAYAEISNTYGSFNTRKHSLKAGTGLLENRWTIDARLSSLSSDGYIDRASTSLQSFFTSAAWYGNKTLLRANVFSGNEKTYQAWDGVPSYILDTNRTWNGIGSYYDADGKIHYYDNETDNYKQDHYQLFYTRSLIPGTSINLAGHYTRGFGYYEQYKDDHRYSAYGLSDVIAGGDTLERTDLIRRKFLDNHFYGALFSLNYDNLKKLKLMAGGAVNQYDGDHYGRIIWMQFAENTPKDYEWYSGNGAKTDYNAYLKAIWQTTEKISLYGDLQYRGIDYRITGIDDDLKVLDINKHYNFFNPKAGVNFKASDKHRFTFSWAVANREPTRSNFTDADAGKIPQPERMNNFETGYHLNLTKLNLGMNIYFMEYHNQLVLTGEINNVGDPVMTNVPVSYRRGIEITGAWKPLPKLSLTGNSTFSRNKIIGFTEYVDDWDTWSQRVGYLGTTDLSFSPEITAAVALNYKALKNLEFSLVSKYIGKQFIDNTSSRERMLKPYSTTNVIISYKLKTKWVKEAECLVAVNNLFNAKYVSNAWVYRYYENNEQGVYDGYFPQAGIHFLAGLNLRF